MENMKFTI